MKIIYIYMYVFLIHKPFIRFTFSGRRITLFAPAWLGDS